MLLVFSVQSASAWILSAYIYGLSEVMTISAIQDCFRNRQILVTMKAIQKMPLWSLKTVGRSFATAYAGEINRLTAIDKK